LEVERLLRLAVGPERDLPVCHHVVHGDQVREAAGAIGRKLDLVACGQERSGLLSRHRDQLPLFHEALPNPIISVASDSVSSHANPAPVPSPVNAGPIAAATESAVHICASGARNTARTRGGSMTAATPPWTTNTSPLIAAADGLARYVTNGATCSGASWSTAPSGASPMRSLVIAVRARGQIALARTPYLAQLRAVVTVSAAMPAFAAA